MTGELVDRVAEAVLYEGYLLFPYRPSALKNQQRWTFGGVYPRGGGEPSSMQTQCLVLGAASCRLAVTVRFLHVAEIDAREEAIERQFVAEARIDELLGPARRVDMSLPAGEDRGRAYQALSGHVDVSAESVEDGLWRLTVHIENDQEWGAASRPRALRTTFVSTHTILRVSGGEFVSLLEPPDELQAAAESCRNLRTWPVLVGAPGERHTLLSSPIILYDYPEVAPESRGNFFDTTEVDELLTLSVLALTDEEKAEVRAADARGRELLERTEALSPEDILRLHGVVRELR
jgi:hypothetical protein